MLLDAKDDLIRARPGPLHRPDDPVGRRAEPTVLMLDTHLPTRDLGKTLAAAKAAAPATNRMRAGAG
jgi:hypothetical protein